MAGSKIFPLRLPDATRARWQAAAGANVPLAEFVKDAVEEKIARDVTLPPQIPPPKPTDSLAAVVPGVRPGGSATTTSTGGKVFRGPDPKGGKSKK